MMTKDIKMKIISRRYDVEDSLFSKIVVEQNENEIEEDIFFDDLSFDEEEIIEINTEGTMKIDGTQVSLVYEESEITGMEGSSTVISFDSDNSGFVSMIREGAVSTTLLFERGKRHHCVYNTPIMPFEICVKTLTVENEILTSGRMKLDYIIEIRGAKAERNKFEMSVIENK